MTAPFNDPPETQRTEIARLSGQVLALEMAVKVLFLNHPDSARLAGLYTTAIDGLLDITIATRMPEEMRDAVDQARRGVLEVLAAARLSGLQQP